jgi:dienelactone hydrolase
MRRLLAALLIGTTTLALAGEPAQAPKARTGKRTLSEASVALRKKAVYEPSTFEMDVAPPVKAGDVIVETLSYPSPVKSVDPDRNDTVRARLFRTEKPEPAAVIALGGWRFDPYTPQLAREIAATGIQALYVEIPFQGSRTPRGRRPGELTLSADLDQNEATFVQVAQDVGRAVEWLVTERKVDRKRIGIVGTSLGGFVANTLYGMQDRFSCCASLLSGADVASVIFNGNYLTARIRQQLVAAKITEARVRERMRGLDPLTWADPEKKAGLLLVAAERDAIVPLRNVRKLARAYDDARVVVARNARHVSLEALRSQVPTVKAHLELRLLGRKSAAKADAQTEAEKPKAKAGAE